jgi:signal transduction histidine kinase
LFAGGGEMGLLMRAHDWESTALGPVNTWPQSLLTSLSLCLHSKFPTVIYWGPQVATFYNDGYAPILASKHPWAIGRPIQEVWADIWVDIKDMVDGVVSTGVATWSEDKVLYMHRKGYLEECYFTWSFAPITVESGDIGGLYCAVTETTERVLGERRLRTLRDLGKTASDARALDRACDEASRVVGTNTADIPFSLLYLLDADRTQARLASASGIAVGHAESPKTIAMDNDHAPWPLHRVARTNVEELASGIAIRLPDPAVPDVVTSALVMPLTRAGQSSLYGFLVMGVSPRRALDENYRAFFHLVAEHVTAAVSNATAYEEERRHAQALAEIDRAKTAFFSNVSHEFRTPLTLILGPVEDALAQPEQSLHGATLEAVHRSALRLLRLVNSLLDFARIEAGRVQVSFVPTDLSSLTADLASSFRSLIERAGLTLVVNCAPLPQPVYVDPTQWEKIVLNLISNAFKFTLQGEIAIALRPHGDHVELTVRDTGTGIPTHEMPHVFERFHRVEGSTGRSFEGTGIGLSLVHELVKLHGGSVHVSSVEGEGSTFVVTLPIGSAHLPAEHVGDRGSAPTATNAAPYLLEAARWIGPDQDAWTADEALIEEAGSPVDPPRAPGRERERVLVADDNADMREYLARLLSRRWRVEVARDGQAALEAARRQPPDLVLSDVMMPRLDGFALVRELRADPTTRQIPVVLLSARAGEEAVLEGLATGADDYLVKPFAARELLARVQTHLELARLRREWATELERANNELEAFSYSVSHDLRAPLRAIDGFSQALLADYADKLDEQGRHYLQRVRSGTQRMAQLIDDLLSLARITRTALSRQRVDMTGLARQVLIELGERAPERRVECRVSDGLVVHADIHLLRVMLENLLGNAWKFTAKQEAAKIEVGQETRGDGTVFFVTDNGAGFDMAHANKLFAPFQRLHTEAEFEGTGIGLATVHRVVTRHGGRVWAEALPGQGATFLFTLGA